jgi:DNA-binding NarL/FixJ family response regulator
MDMSASTLIRVAVIDDHIMVSEMLALSISKAIDLDLVDVASNVSDALDLVRRDRPDVVLVNCRLPDGDGIDVIRKILEEFPATRFVMLSGTGDHHLRAQIFEGDFVRFLGRDRSISEILNTVRSAARNEPVIRTDEYAILLDSWSAAPKR